MTYADAYHIASLLAKALSCVHGDTEDDECRIAVEDVERLHEAYRLAVGMAANEAIRFVAGTDETVALAAANYPPVAAPVRADRGRVRVAMECRRCGQPNREYYIGRNGGADGRVCVECRLASKRVA